MEKIKFKTAFDVVKNLDLSGKVYLVTGGYSGLGAVTVKALLKAKGKVIIVGRNKTAQDKFVRELMSNKDFEVPSGQIDATFTMDLEDLASVSKFAKYIDGKYDQIDVLINNAGVMRTPPAKTKDGFEIQMGTNVIGHFLLAKILAPKTKRQVWLSSVAHKLMDQYPGEESLENAPRIDFEMLTKVDHNNYNSWRRYQQSKLGNILLSKQFIKEYPNLQSYAVHPGAVQTNISRHYTIWELLKAIPKLIKLGQFKMLKPEYGAATQVYCSVASDSVLENGAYYFNCNVEQSSKASQNEDDAKKLYDFCNHVTKSFQ